MKIEITIPDADSTRVLEGIGAATGWTQESGKTKAVWARERAAAWVKDTAKRGLLRKSQTNINAEIDAVVLT